MGRGDFVQYSLLKAVLVNSCIYARTMSYFIKILPSSKCFHFVLHIKNFSSCSILYHFYVYLEKYKNTNTNTRGIYFRKQDAACQQAASCEGEGFKKRYKRSKLEMFKDYH